MLSVPQITQMTAVCEKKKNPTIFSCLCNTPLYMYIKRVQQLGICEPRTEKLTTRTAMLFMTGLSEYKRFYLQNTKGCFQPICYLP